MCDRIVNRSEWRKPSPATVSHDSTIKRESIAPRKRSVNTMTKMMKCLQLLVLSIMMISSVWAAEPINTLERSGLWGYKPSGIAVRGYDTVAYFTQGKPVKGREDIATSWMGATWYFSSTEHRDLFIEAPEQYAPQYGGYCAYGVAVDSLVKIEVDRWDIVDGKLYLNYDKKFQENWHADIPGFIQTADDKFEKLLATES